jgi:ERCC4-type nuclease
VAEVTPMPKGYKFMLDSREKDKMKELVKRKGIIHEIDALNADFVLRKSGEVMQDIVGIERKAVADLVQSIQSKRIFDQIPKLKHNHKICFLFISGSLEDHEAKLQYMNMTLHKPVIYGSLASMIVRDRLNVMWFPNDNALVEMAYRICVKIAEGKWGEERSLEPKYEMYDPLKVLRSHVPGVSLEKAKLLMTTFGNLKGVAMAELTQLQVVLGPETSALVFQLFHKGI